MYTLYCHENKVNGKKYIGITKEKPERRWNNGKGYSNNTYFTNAIKKYGWNGFKHVILRENLTEEEAYATERVYKANATHESEVWL